jgi:peroxiredoxin
MRIFALSLLLLPFTLMAQMSADVVISGSLKGIPDNTELTLRDQDPEVETIAAAKAKDGKFILKAKLPNPNLYYLSYAGSDQKLFLFLEASTVSVSGHKDSLSAAMVTGSATHAAFAEFNKNFSPLFGKASQLSQQLNAGQSDPAGTLKKEYDAVVGEINTKTDAYVQQYSTSAVAPFVILVMSQMAEDPAIMEKRYGMLAPDAKESLYGQIISKSIADARIGALGSDAIEFTQNDESGKPVTLSSFRGKYVLVDFWASWCKPCRMENPNVVDAYTKYKSRNFTVLGVSLDRSKDAWVQAIKDDKLDWTQVSDLKFWNNEVAQLYRIQSIPQNLLIDPAGKIIAKNLRGEELQVRLAQLLK